MESPWLNLVVLRHPDRGMVIAMYSPIFKMSGGLAMASVAGLGAPASFLAGAVVRVVASLVLTSSSTGCRR